MNRPVTNNFAASILLLFAGCAAGQRLDDEIASGETSGSTTGEATDSSPGPDTAAAPRPEEIRSFVGMYCDGCHGEESEGFANIRYINDLAALVDNGLVVPGDPEGSRLYQRLISEESPMPPLGEPVRPSEAEIGVIREWIVAGALPGEGSCSNAFVGFDDMFRLMRIDLTEIDEAGDQRNIRYLTLTHLHNAGMCDRELDLYRQALAKGLNSLSLRPELVPLRAIDELGTIFRIDLRDYGWDSNPNFSTEDLWDTLAGVNPFAVAFRDGDADLVRELTGTAIPFQPADSFLQIATGGLLAGVSPALDAYYRILQLPSDLDTLERLPFIDVPDRAAAIAAGEVDRVILQNSGVARFNRAFDCTVGAGFGSYYCRSFDFAGEDGDRNVFNNPTDFVPDGGEVIFTLPNGLQGYAIANAAGQLVREAPTAIVKDPGQADAVVRAGISCMSCHADGIIPKRDTFHDYYRTVEGNFVEGERDEIEKLLADPDGALARQKLYSQQFKGRLSALGIAAPTPEPIFSFSRQFEADLDLERVASELGMSGMDLGFEFGGLDNAFDKLRRGTMTRDELAGLYRASICFLLPGEDVLPDCVPG